MSMKKRNINTYLEEVFKQFVAIKDGEYKKSRGIFDAVFQEVHQKMGGKCNYFKKYGKQVMYAGSVYDGIKVSKLDEFDMDIVIRLPINYKDGPNGIIIENEEPGFVKMKIINAFDNLDKQKDWEKCHRVTREWRDSDKYLLQNKFRNWIHGLVQKALTEMGGKATVDGVTYLVTYKESGPAYTLNIRNEAGGEEFVLDVDLVPVIRFLLPRWPDGYREVGHSHMKEWLVVPKPNKFLEDKVLKNRCWRLSFQEFEREIMKGCQQFKITIRLVKKLRDALELKAIASYYIKTLFLWKINENKNKSHWEKKLGILFRDMVQELYDAIKNKNIPYYWNEKHNLIKDLKSTLQDEYMQKLKKVIQCIDADHVDQVVAFLLTPEELKEFQNSDFYMQQMETKANLTIASVLSAASPGTGCQTSLTQPRMLAHVSLIAQIASLHEEVVAYQHSTPPCDKLFELERKYYELEKKLQLQEEKLKMLECEKGYREKFFALTMAFNEFMNNAVRSGLMPGNDRVTTGRRFSPEINTVYKSEEESEQNSFCSKDLDDVSNKRAAMSCNANNIMIQ